MWRITGNSGSVAHLVVLHIISNGISHGRQMTLADGDRFRHAIFDLPSADVRTAENWASDRSVVVTENAAGVFVARHAGEQSNARVGRVIGQGGHADRIGWRWRVVVVEVAVGGGTAATRAC